MNKQYEQAAVHIESLIATIREQQTRIEALETALRVAKTYVCDLHAMRAINAALDKDAGK